MPNALPSLLLRTPPGWTARRIELAVRAAASLELELVAAEPGETAAALARRLEGTDALDVRRIGDREVAVLVRASEARLFSTDGELAWVGVLRHDDPALVDAAAGLMAGAAREIVAPWLTADFSEEELTVVAELAGLRAFPGVAPAAPLGERERQTVRRALAARGTVRGLDDGRIGFAPRDWPLFAVSLAPDAVLEAEHQANGDRRRALVSWRHETFVTQAAALSGVVRLTAFPSAFLDRWLAGFFDLDRPAAGGRGTVRLLRRGEDRLSGAELRWSSGAEGLRLAGAAVAPADLRARLRALLDP